MTDARAWIDQVDARTNAAEEGPWKVNDLRNAPDGNRDCIWVDVDNGRTYATVADMDEDEGLRAVWGLADAEFIAHARTDLPAATTALRAVLDLHRADHEGRCVEDVEDYPCPTVKAVQEGLTGRPVEWVDCTSAPPVVDEMGIADAILARYSSFDPLTAQGIAAAVVAYLRGVTR